MSSSNCCFLTCIQVFQEAGQVVWDSHVFQNFPQFVVIHTVKGFDIVNKADIDVFWNSLAFSMIQWMLAIWSLIPVPFLKPIWASWSSSFMLLKPGLENFEHYFASMWNEHNCVLVWTFFGTALLWDWNEHWPFPVLWPLLSFPDFLTYWVQVINSISFRLLNSSAGILSPPLTLFIVMLPKAHLTSPSRMSGCRWMTHHPGYPGH